MKGCWWASKRFLKNVYPTSTVVSTAQKQTGSFCIPLFAGYDYITSANKALFIYFLLLIFILLQAYDEAETKTRGWVLFNWSSSDTTVGLKGHRGFIICHSGFNFKNSWWNKPRKSPNLFWYYFYNSQTHICI